MKKRTIIFISIFSVTILAIFACIIAVGGIGAITYLVSNNSTHVEAMQPILSPSAEGLSKTITPTLRKTNTVEATLGETPQVSKPESTAMPAIQETPAALPTISNAAPIDTLKSLEQAIVPINDPLDLAQRLEGKQNLPEKMEIPPAPLPLGVQEAFWVMDTDTNENFQVQATLQYITEHVYFWIEDGVTFNQNHLKNLVETFENEIYPTNRTFFGEEWTPGVDADPHIYILYSSGLGRSVAGYFSTADEYLPLVRENSNAHEMFLLSADHVSLDQEYAYSVLAHEFQHMIHWKRDRNEETWMNEGFSNLAVLLNGYSVGGSDRAYVKDPDIQLNDWPNGPNRSPYYGSSFLFMTYFLDRFGEQATQALVSEPSNGMVSIDKILSELGETDSLTNTGIGANDVFSDWVIASYLQDPDVADGRYTYHNYSAAPQPSFTEEIRSCPQAPINADVSQYGVDYIRITCRGDYTINFKGDTEVGVLPVNPYSGSYAFYSNRGDESDMTLTREFDFTDQNGPLSLTFWTWYDLEEDYDYLYLTASTDGETWQIITTPSGTPEDPSGNSYGWAYNGLSSSFGKEGPDWIQEKVDISQFAGQKVQLRFEYVTDAAVNGEGFLLDDISIPETGYSSDFESDDGGWIANGFVRIQNMLPQTFSLSLIRIGKDTVVDKITLQPDNSANIPIQIGDGYNEVVLVVSGTTRFTRQKANYSLSITP